MIKKFDEFINEANIMTSVKNKIINFNRYGNKDIKNDIKGLLKGLVHMNDGVEAITGGVKIKRDDSFYYLYTNGKVITPKGSEFYIDEDDAKILFYDFIKKK